MEIVKHFVQGNTKCIIQNGEFEFKNVYQQNI